LVDIKSTTESELQTVSNTNLFSVVAVDLALVGPDGPSARHSNRSDGDYERSYFAVTGIPFEVFKEAFCHVTL
jgi:hypothetical protein